MQSKKHPSNTYQKVNNDIPISTEEKSDLNLFMVCNKVDTAAFIELDSEFTIRDCYPGELDFWKDFQFDDPKDAKEYRGFMDEYVKNTFGRDMDLFFRSVKFVCDKNNIPIGTALIWKAYNKFYTIQWFKVHRDHTGKGIGRAILSTLLKDLDSQYFPIYIHTHPTSYKAIKLYSDFGFHFLDDKQDFGLRKNDLKESVNILKNHMPKKSFEKLQITEPSEYFIHFIKQQNTIQF